MASIIVTETEAAVRNAERPRIREELREKLRSYNFTHFITLASNHQDISQERMRSLLKEWDARVNRTLNGPKWQDRPDERLVWFAFPEKMDVNPHWHLLVEVDPEPATETRALRLRQLKMIAKKHWLRLLPRGSFDCQAIDSKRVVDYVTKVTAKEENLAGFVVYREFMTK